MKSTLKLSLLYYFELYFKLLNILLRKNVRVFVLGVLTLFCVFACSKKNASKATQNIQIIFKPQVEEGIFNSTNNQINTMTLIAFNGKNIDVVYTLNKENVYWLSEKSNWNVFDSLIVFANMRENDVAKIKQGMSFDEYHQLSFGGYPNDAGLQPPFLMKGILTQEDLKKAINGNVSIIMKPMVTYIRFNNSSSLPIDKIVIQNVDTTVASSAIPMAGTYTIEDKPSALSQFGYYVYPSKNFVITITKNEKTITQNIDEIQANRLLEIDITDSDVPQQKGYKFYINNKLVTAENSTPLSLPDNGGYLYAYLDNNLDLQLQNLDDWIRIYTPPSARSTNTTGIVAKISTPLKLVASFSTGVMYQEVASTQYIFDAYYMLNKDRKTLFNIIDKSSKQVVASIEGIQKGEGNIAINAKNIEGKKIILAQQGGEMEFTIHSSSNNIEIIAPSEFLLIEKKTITEIGGNFEYLYKYKIEPTISTTETQFLLIAKDNAIHKSDTIYINQQPLIMSADRQSLIQIFQKLGGTQWTNHANKNWNTGYPLNQWEGISVNEDNRVIGLNLKDNSNIKGNFPVEITQLLALQQLVIGTGNEVTGSIPKEIGNLTALTTFKTTGNKMAGDLPKELSSLTKLADMNIAKQYHTGKIWKELQVIPAYKDESTFKIKVRTQYEAGTTTEIILPIESSDQQVATLQVNKFPQFCMLNLPGNINGETFSYTSIPEGHTITLAFNNYGALANNKTSIKATLPENTSGGNIIYTINVFGKNNTTGISGNYSYTITQTTDATARKDGDVREFMKSTEPKDNAYGVVFMADGFILEDLQQGKDYDKYADEVLSYIFSKEPFATYKDYFSVYVVYVESPNRGLGGKLNGSYNAGPTADANIVRNYSQKAPGNVFGRLVFLNYELTDGTVGGQGLTFADINSIFLKTDAKETAIHEFGHTFGLADEYSSGGGARPPIYNNNMANISNTNDLNNIKWKHFIGLKGYEGVGAYEGALYNPNKYYRPENFSIMRRYNRDYFEFNAPSRERIVKVIRDRTGEKYDFQEFLKLDKPVPQP